MQYTEFIALSYVLKTWIQPELLFCFYLMSFPQLNFLIVDVTAYHFPKVQIIGINLQQILVLDIMIFIFLLSTALWLWIVNHWSIWVMTSHYKCTCTIFIQKNTWTKFPSKTKYGWYYIIYCKLFYSNQCDSNSSTNRYYLVGDSVAFSPSPNHLHSNLIEKQAPLIYVSTSKPSIKLKTRLVILTCEQWDTTRTSYFQGKRWASISASNGIILWKSNIVNRCYVDPPTFSAFFRSWRSMTAQRGTCTTTYWCPDHGVSIGALSQWLLCRRPWTKYCLLFCSMLFLESFLLL